MTLKKQPDGTRLAARQVHRTSGLAMAQDEDIRIEPFTHAAGGWTAVNEVAHALGEAHIRLEGTRILLQQRRRAAPTSSASRSCAASTSSTPRSTATTIASAASTARATC